MTTVVGVRFREIGKIYTFDPGELSLRRGDHVIVETAKGNEYGTVVLGNYQICEGHLEQPLRMVLRGATEQDESRVAEHREKEAEALRICRQKVSEHQLDMKVIAVEAAFDENKLLFFFTADGRVDFRELVKDLASVFHVRIELRQVGVRDETKILGGMGPCGRALCCHSWLSDFVPVSIKMAKEQNLSLNPQKISGVCGRLMCCLKNEADTYAYLNAQLPKKGDMVALEDGLKGEIMDINVLKQTVRVLVLLDNDEREIREVPAGETTFIAHRKKGQPSQLKKDAMARRESQLQEQRERSKKKSREKDGIEHPEKAEEAEERTPGCETMGGRKRRIRSPKPAHPTARTEERSNAEEGGAGSRHSIRGAEEEPAAKVGEGSSRPKKRRRRRPSGEQKNREQAMGTDVSHD